MRWHKEALGNRDTYFLSVGLWGGRLSLGGGAPLIVGGIFVYFRNIEVLKLVKFFTFFYTNNGKAKNAAVKLLALVVVE